MKQTYTASILALTLALPACGSSADNSAKIDATRTQKHRHEMSSGGDHQTHATPPTDFAATTKALLAAAEPFEALTETAFSAGKSQRNKASKAAADALRGVQGILPQNILEDLNHNMTAISAADVADNPADLALASIENYRILVSAVPGTPAVPADVSLLDYAGFRFDADAQAAPTRWDDMFRTLEFARQRWAALAQHAAAAKVKLRFEAALAGMEQAARDKNVAHARSAAKNELDLVDVLEAAFANARHAKV